MPITRYKYPRTPHLPWSSGTSDDITSTTLPWADDTEIVVLEKLDGECTSIYPDGYMHARSTTYSPHPSRDRLKARALMLAMGLDKGEILLGENLYAQHSIHYTNLEDYFYLFGVRDEVSFWSWDGVVTMAECIGVPTSDVLYRGPLKNMNLNLIWPHASRLVADQVHDSACRAGTALQGGYVCEGYVIRTAGPFPVHEFSLNVRKYVRPGHVTTDDHWLHGAGSMFFNQLRETVGLL